MSEPTNGDGGGEPRVRPVGAVARPAGAAAASGGWSGAVRPEAATRAAPDWDLVRKRNNVEKLKHEKFPLEILDEIPALGEMDYHDISEEDMVRFQWYGLYHDKPKVGYDDAADQGPGGHPDRRRSSASSASCPRSSGATTPSSRPARRSSFTGSGSATCRRSSRRWRASG